MDVVIIKLAAPKIFWQKISILDFYYKLKVLLVDLYWCVRHDVDLIILGTVAIPTDRIISSGFFSTLLISERTCSWRQTILPESLLKKNLLKLAGMTKTTRMAQESSVNVNEWTRTMWLALLYIQNIESQCVSSACWLINYLTFFWVLGNDNWRKEWL